MKVLIDKDWCLRMAELEGDHEVGTGYESLTTEGSKRFTETIARMVKFPDKDD